jgi:hypothetical protein
MASRNNPDTTSVGLRTRHTTALPEAPGHDEDDLPIMNPMANVAISIRRPRRIALDDMAVSLPKSFFYESDGHLKWAVERTRMDTDSHDSGVGF